MNEETYILELRGYFLGPWVVGWTDIICPVLPTYFL
jgi:hypothetical protein